MTGSGDVLERADRLATQARARLAAGSPEPGSIGATPVDALQDAASELCDLMLAGGSPSAAVTAAQCRTLIELTALQGELRSRDVERRFLTVAEIHAGLARLRSAGTLSELLEAAVRELAAICHFDRAAVSRRAGASWRG